MEAYQRDFLSFIHDRGALRFGEFQTKSGRTSPYFFNAGGLDRGSDLNALAEVYASALEKHFPEGVDIIYGPAYKGIPLAVMTAMVLARRGHEIAYCFNRKEAKDHGEKGTLVGRTPKAGDRVVVIDDVITAGTSVRETMTLLSGIDGLNVVGILVGLDRMEKGIDSQLSAVQQVSAEHGIPVASVADINGVISMLESGAFKDVPESILEAVRNYRATYGVS